MYKSVSDLINAECPEVVVVNYNTKGCFYSFSKKEIGLSCDYSSESVFDLFKALHEIGHSRDTSMAANFFAKMPRGFLLFCSPLMLAFYAILLLLGVNLFYILPLLVIGSFVVLTIEFNADRFVLRNCEKYGLRKRGGYIMIMTNSFLYYVLHLLFQYYFITQFIKL